MTFTRQRSDGTHETNQFETSNLISRKVDSSTAQSTGQRPITSRLMGPSLRNLATLAITVFAITVPTLLPAQARYYSRYKRYNKSRSYQKYSRTNQQKTSRRTSDEVTTGVRGWTKGSQTYLRVRPSAKTPFVAKVPRHTELFVWGKFDGWYRVETPDHIFGWVFHQYVNAPEERKLKELSHAKAKIACDRSAKQLMYGTPEMLRSYYAAYRAPGAMRGLEKLGIRVAGAKPKTKTVAALKSKQPAVRTVAKSVTTKPVRAVAKTAPRVITPRASAPKVVSAPANVAPTTVHAPEAVGNTARPVAPSLIPVENKAPVKPQVVKQTTVKKQTTRTASSTRSKKQRQNKRGRRPVVAAVPPMQVSGMSTITADDILRAREAHLGARHKTRPTAPATKLPERIEEAPANQGAQADANGGAAVQPSSLFTAPSMPSANETNAIASRAVLPTPLRGANGASPVVTLVSLKKAPAASKTSKTAKAATTKALPNRGGSPRDYARYAAQSNAFGNGMATQALSYRGMPYIRGAASPNRGFDCSGLVYHLLRQRGYNPPRTSSALASYGTPVAKNQLAPGDILLFSNTYRRGVSHVGIYLGNDKFVHAANHRAGVRVDPLFSGYYARKYYGARRVKVRK